MKEVKSLLSFILLTSFNALAIEPAVKSALDKDNILLLRKFKQTQLNGMARDRAGRSPLLYAIQYKKYNSAKYLITRDLGVNAKDYLGRTPIIVSLGNNIPFSLIKLLVDNGADLKAVDKNGRSLEFYIKKNKNKEIKEYIRTKIQEIPKVTSKQRKELKEAFESSQIKKINAYIQKYKTINIKLNNEDVIDYLIDTKLITKWSIDYLASLGVNIFGQDVGHKLLKKGLYDSFKQLNSYRVNILKNSKGKSLLEVALKREVPSSILLDIIKRQKNLNILDNEGNNYLHLAYKYKRYEVVESLKSRGVRTNQLNNDLDTPFMILLNNEPNKEIIKKEVKSQVPSLSVKGRNGTNGVILLASKHPDLLKSHITELRNLNYDFSYSDLTGSNALEVFNSSVERADFDKIESDFQTLDNLSRGDISKVDLEKEDQEILEYKDGVDTPYFGDRLLENFITGSLSEYVGNLREEFRKYVVEKNNLEFTESYKELLSKKSKLEKKERELNKNISRDKTKLNELLTLHRERRFRLESVNTDSFELTRKNAYSKMQTNLNALVNYVNYVDEDLREFEEKKVELEAVILLFKAGQDAISLEIKEVREEIGNLKKKLQLDVKDYRKEKNVDLQFLKDKLADSKERVNHDRKQIDNLEDNRRNKNKKLNKLSIRIDYLSQKENHPGHNPANCRWTKEKKVVVKNRSSVRKEIKSLGKSIKKRRDLYKQSKNEFYRVQNELSKESSRIEKMITKFEKKLKNEIQITKNRLEGKLVELEASREYDRKDVELESNVLLENISNRYGSVTEIESNWPKIRLFTEQIAAKKNLKDSFGCAMYLCAPILNLKDNSPMANEFNKLATQVAQAYGHYSQVHFSNSIYVNVINNLKSTESKITSIKTQMLSNQEMARELSKELYEVSVDLKETDTVNNDEIDELVKLEEVKFFQELIDGDIKYSNDHKRLRDDLLQNSDKTLNSFSEKIEPLYSDWDLMDLSLHSNLENIKTYENKEKIFVLKKWLETYSKSFSVNNEFYHFSKIDYLVAALKDKLEVTLVTDGRDRSLKLSTGFGDFLLNESGVPTILETEEKSPLHFEIVSTGEVRKRIESIVKKLERKYKNAKLSDLKEDYNFSLVVSLLKIVDQINDIEKTKETLDLLEVVIGPMLAVSPGGQILAPALGLSKCAFTIYSKNKFGGFSSGLEKYRNVSSCLSEILIGSKLFSDRFKLVSDVFEGLVPSKALAEFSVSIFELLAQTKSPNIVKVFSQGFFNLFINDLDSKVFVENGNMFNHLRSAYKFTKGNVEFQMVEKLLYSGVETKLVRVKINNEVEVPEIIVNGNLRIYDVCGLKMKLIKDFVENELNTKVFSFESKLNNVLDSQEQYHVKVGNLCLYLSLKK